MDLFHKFRDAARLAGLIAFFRLALLLSLVTPTLATDRTLCLQLPELRPKPGARVVDYPNSTADRCVTRALWDIQKSSMYRVRGDDAGDGPDATALRCVPTQEAFLCDGNLGSSNDLFACELTDAPPEGTAMDMETCVWPVCTQICAETGTRRDEDWEIARACDRCVAACEFRGTKPNTADSVGGRFCASPARRDRQPRRKDADARARSAYAYALGGWGGMSAAAAGLGGAGRGGRGRGGHDNHRSSGGSDHRGGRDHRSSRDHRRGRHDRGRDR